MTTEGAPQSTERTGSNIALSFHLKSSRVFFEEELRNTVIAVSAMRELLHAFNADDACLVVLLF